VGLDALEAACPGLHKALTDLGYGAQLCSDCDDKLTLASVSELLALHDRYITAPNTAAPNPAAVHTILEGMDKQADHQASWWERFKNWLRDLIGSRSGKTPSWFERLFERLRPSEFVWGIIAYTLIGVVVAVAIAVVIVEMRAAGLFTKWGIAPIDRKRVANESSNAGELSFADVESAPVNERPGLMLRLLANVLVSNRQLTAERNLTHRELARLAQFVNAPDRERFEQLALLAESIRYGKPPLELAASCSHAANHVGCARAVCAVDTTFVPAQHAPRT